MVEAWEKNENILQSGDRVKLRHEDGREYGPVTLRSLAIDPATLYVPGMVDGSIRQAKSIEEWLDAGWRVVEFEPGDQLPVKPGLYKVSWVDAPFPLALYGLDEGGRWCCYEKKGFFTLPNSTPLAPFDL